MSTGKPGLSTAPVWPPGLPADYIQLPNPPKKEDMTSPIYLLHPGKSKALELWLGNRDTTLFLFDQYVVPSPVGRLPQGTVYPDMLIAFNVDPQLAHNRNGYTISDHGKPPDLVMEIASKSTAHIDENYKRRHYASLRIPEYWRFDHTGGDLLRSPLAGDRLAGDLYQPVPIEELSPSHFHGYSEALRLHVCWEDGQLQWFDAPQNAHLLDHEGEVARANAAEAELQRLRALLDHPPEPE